MKNNETAETKPVELKKQALESWENEGGEIPKLSKTVKEASPGTPDEGRGQKHLTRTLPVPPQPEKSTPGNRVRG